MADEHTRVRPLRVSVAAPESHQQVSTGPMPFSFSPTEIRDNACMSPLADSALSLSECKKLAGMRKVLHND